MEINGAWNDNRLIMSSDQWSVLLDTNFLLAPVELGVDVSERLDDLLGDYRIRIPVCVKAELKKLRSEGKKKEEDVNVALKIADRFEEIEIGRGMDPDKALLEYAPNKNVVVCTNDRDLIDSLRENGVPVIFVRQNKLLEKIGITE